MTAQTTLKTQSQLRVQSIDILRGVIIIIMALDHVRDFFHADAASFSPEDLARTTPALFFTRWITHFCAPVFLFTAGLGAFLWLRRGRSRAELSRFLWTRGLWLIFLELTVARFGLYFNLDYSIVLLLILWAIGGSMIALAGLVYLPVRALAFVSVGMIALHNLLDGIQAAQFGSAAWAWNMAHQQGVFKVGGRAVLLAYPLIPWIGVMAAGYCFGGVFLLEPARRQRLCVRLGLGLTLGFLLLRSLNVYGDPAPWSGQRSPLFTALSFLRCTKYPPSLDYLLMTLGPAIAVMGWLDRVRLPAANPLIVFGRTPMFYYVVHLYLIHGLAMLLAFFRYGRASFFLNAPVTMGGPRKEFPANYGYDLWVCYAVWLVLVAMLYPLCRWFAQMKGRRRDWWLSYL